MAPLNSNSLGLKMKTSRPQTSNGMHKGSKQPLIPHFDLTLPTSEYARQYTLCRAASGAIPTMSLSVNPSAYPLVVQPKQGLSQAVTDPLPPLFNKATRLTLIEDGLWQYEQDFLFREVAVRGWAVRLLDGTYLVGSLCEVRCHALARSRSLLPATTPFIAQARSWFQVKPSMTSSDCNAFAAMPP